jgi:hypothetical protein
MPRRVKIAARRVEPVVRHHRAVLLRMVVAAHAFEMRG